MFHRVDGHGEPLLLLNGIAMSVASWEEMARPLAEHFRVVRFDFRGQLLSPGAPPRDVLEHASEVVDLLDRLAIDRAHLVATSFGGAVALLVAARWPQRVRSLISIASADAFDDVMAEEVARWRQACLDSVASGDRGLISDVLEPVVYSPATWPHTTRSRRCGAARSPRCPTPGFKAWPGCSTRLRAWLFPASSLRSRARRWSSPPSSTASSRSPAPGRSPRASAARGSSSSRAPATRSSSSTPGLAGLCLEFLDG